MNILNDKNVLIIDEKYPDFFTNLLISKGYKLNKNQEKNRTLIDWELTENVNSILYYFEGCEDAIKEKLSNSPINDDRLNLFIEFGPNEPMIKTKGSYFVRYWDDLVLDYGSMGTTIVSETGEYILEFTDDTYWLLFTNFPLARVTRVAPPLV